jgi:hypothetical protein
MTDANRKIVTIAVEGPPDEAVARRLIEYVGGMTGAVLGLNGKKQLIQRLDGYNRAAQHGLWLVVVDLDQGGLCAPALRQTYMPSPAPGMIFRVAVHEMEAWVMADRDRLAGYLSVSRDRIPVDPDSIPDPKQALVNLARRSRRSAIRDDMVPSASGGREVGPGYTGRLIEFVSDASSGWRPQEAESHSDSLHRCLRHLRSLVGDDSVVSRFNHLGG